MDQTLVVLRAVERFHAGDDAGFLECFAPAVAIYGEPAIVQRPLVTSRAELAEWLASWRQSPRGEVRMENVVQHDQNCVLADLVALESNTGGGWRLAARIGFTAQLISEVRLFWSRSSAMG